MCGGGGCSSSAGAGIPLERGGNGSLWNAGIGLIHRRIRVKPAGADLDSQPQLILGEMNCFVLSGGQQLYNVLDKFHVHLNMVIPFW